MARLMSTYVVKTKLQPPRLKEHVLLRPQLSKRLRGMFDYPLTLIQAGPGFGKSTALASFLAHESHPFCWYSVSEYDAHFPSFFCYIVEALRTRYPWFGDQWEDSQPKTGQRLNEQHVYALSSLFVNECMVLPEKTVLVIDDYYLVEHVEEIDRFMNWLILHLPDSLHLVLVTRTHPRWDILHLLKVKGELLEITEEDLVFSEEDIEVLFSEHYQHVLSEKDIRLIHRKTEGWIMAIQMIWQRLQTEYSINQILNNQASTLEELFQFMANEVLAKQPATVRTFMLESSVLDTLTAEACQKVLKRADAEQMLSYLHKQHLFLSAVSEQEYRYHALFQAFLQEQLQAQPDRYRVLHQRAAHYYAQRHELEQALHHYQLIGAHEEMAQLLNCYGHLLLKKGNLDGLLHSLTSLPSLLKDRYVRLWSYEGDIYRYRSLYEKALLCYQRAAEQARINGDVLGESLGREGEARIYLDTIQPKKAEYLLRQAIGLLEREPETYSERLIHLYTLMAENAINLGKAKEAERWYAKSREMQKDFQEDLLEIRLYLRTGRLASALKLLEKKKKNESLGQVQKLPRSHRETELLLSLIYACMGEGDKAKACAQEGISQGIQLKSPFVEACGWIRMGHAVQILSPEEESMAAHCYENALEIMDEINMARGKAEPLMGLTLLYGKKGHLELALSYSREGLAETEKVNDLWLSTLLHLSRAVAYIYAGIKAEALAELDLCQRNFQACGDSHGLAVTWLWQSYLFYCQEEWEAFYEVMTKALKLVEKEGYQFLFHKRTLFGPADVQKWAPMLLAAHKREVKTPYLERLLAQMGIGNMSSHPGYSLRIYTLGGFRVYLGEKEVGEKEWKREKAKELFQLFLTKKKHLMPKEHIFQLLWKDQPLEVAARDFKVALNTLNKVLEPERPARAQPFFIQRHGNAYGLNLAAPFELDAAEFEQWVLKGLQAQDPKEAIDQLERGLHLYNGDYLPERNTEDWCLEERERLQVLFLRGAERLAQLYLEQGRIESVIEWCEKIVAVDKCWEEAYRMLMLSYLRLNNRSMVAKWYQKCCQVLQKELGIDPQDEIHAVYHSMMKG